MPDPEPVPAESVTESVPSQPTTAPPRPQNPCLSQCTVHGQKGSSYAVTCNICGLGGDSGLTTSLHKLTYGHYLAQPGNDIKPCVSRAILQAQHPEWFKLLTDKEEKLRVKRR